MFLFVICQYWSDRQWTFTEGTSFSIRTQTWSDVSIPYLFIFQLTERDTSLTLYKWWHTDTQLRALLQHAQPQPHLLLSLPLWRGEAWERLTGGLRHLSHFLHPPALRDPKALQNNKTLTQLYQLMSKYILGNCLCNRKNTFSCEIKQRKCHLLSL